MAISKRLRYEILRRDNHTCRYCGAKAPDVTLTVDHVTPTALGGGDTPDNLVAACRDCNAGKTSSSPDAPLVADVAEDALRWAASVRNALAAIAAREQTVDAEVERFEALWDQWSGTSLGPFPRPADSTLTIERFVRLGLTYDALDRIMQKAMYMTPGVRAEDAFRYFCGICWRTIDEAENIAARGADQ